MEYAAEAATGNFDVLDAIVVAAELQRIGPAGDDRARPVHTHTP
jgi:hypothetical protein